MKVLLSSIAAAFREQRTVIQPSPDVSEKDVERIVRRDFPEWQFETVMAVLAEYSQSRFPKECSRVQLAALKLSQGNLKRLRIHIDNAERDYRSVLQREATHREQRLGSVFEMAAKIRTRANLLNGHTCQITPSARVRDTPLLLSPS